MANKRALRCAIYTRKSSEEGLEQDFNSLDAQREACEAYIKSQAHEGWRCLADRFDDGAYSGGTLERPALRRLLEMVRSRRVDVIVLYKIDRLTRSLADFARLAELFEQHQVSFVSVTQQFNTTTSMGRLTLNVLLSFAQFEREITGERIRDKITASKKKGLWMGGNVPLGYDVKERRLVINAAEAETVCTLFRLFIEHSTVAAVQREAERLCLKTKRRVGPHGRQSGGIRFYPGHIRHILQNPVYIGRTRHKGQSYPGYHQPIIDQATWHAVQERLAQGRADNLTNPSVRHPSPLAGLLFDDQNHRFRPRHAVKAGRRYRYYVDERSMKDDKSENSEGRRIPAAEIEAVVRDGLVQLLERRETLLEALGSDGDEASLDQVATEIALLRHRLLDVSPRVWGEQARSFLQQIVVEDTGIRLRILRAPLRSLLGLPPEDGSAGDDCEERDSNTYDLVITARLSVGGTPMKLIIGNEGDQARRSHDSALIKAVARGHDWFNRLMTGKAASIRQIARNEGLSSSYVSRVLRAAFLAPDIVEAILDGRHPARLTAERLLLREDLSLDWREQRRQLGFDPG